MVAGTVWPCSKHGLAHVLDTALVLLLLAPYHACYAPDHELVVAYVHGMIIISVTFYIIMGKHVYTGPVMQTRRDI